MTRSTVFTSNRSQAVRLPKPVALTGGVLQVELGPFADRAGDSVLEDTLGPSYAQRVELGVEILIVRGDTRIAKNRAPTTPKTSQNC